MCNLKFPVQYVTFLLWSNGGTGDLPVSPYIIDFWPVEQLCEANRDLEIAEFAPGYFAFGGNGANEMFVFKTAGEQWGIYRMPMIGMSESDAIFIAESFQQFLDLVGRVH